MTQHFDPPAPPAAHTTASLAAARAQIDALFGPGYAAENPTLVAAFLQAAAIEYAVTAGQAATAQTLDTLTNLSRQTNETLLKLKPRIFG